MKGIFKLNIFLGLEPNLCSKVCPQRKFLHVLNELRFETIQFHELVNKIVRANTFKLSFLAQARLSAPVQFSKAQDL